jgi:hypothetical protein
MLGGCLKKTTHISGVNSSGYNEWYARAKQDPSQDLYSPELNKDFYTSNSYDIKQQEARLIDIPIPIHADSLGFHEQKLTDGTSDSLVLAYRVHLVQSEIRSFFEIEMERLGWNMIANIQEIESLLVFVKPTKVCTVSLRNNYHSELSSLVVITCGNNKAGYSQE